MVALWVNFRPVGPVSGHERGSAILHTSQATIAACYFKSFSKPNFDKNIKKKFRHEGLVSSFKKYFLIARLVNILLRTGFLYRAQDKVRVTFFNTK